MVALGVGERITTFVMKSVPCAPGGSTICSKMFSGFSFSLFSKHPTWECFPVTHLLVLWFSWWGWNKPQKPQYERVALINLKYHWDPPINKGLEATGYTGVGGKGR